MYTIRFVFLSTHYSKPMDWTEAKAREAENTLRKWRKSCAGADPSETNKDVLNSLRDNLNTAGAIAHLHVIAGRGDMGMLKATAQLLGLLDDAMGDWAKSVDLSKWEDMLSHARAKAMETRDFSEVDRLKSAFVSSGLDVRMSKTDVELVAKAGFQVDRLDGLD